MNDDPKEDQPVQAAPGWGSYNVSYGDDEFGPYPYDTPWPEIAADINKTLLDKREEMLSAEENEDGTVTLSFHHHPDLDTPEPGRIRKMWEAFKSVFFACVALTIAAVAIGLFVAGVWWAMVSNAETRIRARDADKLEEKLKEACRLLDEEGFDGDPRPCLDEDGKPIK